MTDREKLQTARGAAIECYAKLESALSLILTALLDINTAKGSAVFFNLLNVRARNAVLESLITLTHGNLYNAYWNGTPGSSGCKRAPGLFTLIRQLDEERNRIVHWHTVRHESRNADGTQHISYKLIKPDYWLPVESAFNAAIQVNELKAFMQKANFVTLSIYKFWLFTSDQLPLDEKQAWNQIFQQSILYPPPSTHPLFQNYIESESPPQSSPE